MFKGIQIEITVSVPVLQVRNTLNFMLVLSNTLLLKLSISLSFCTCSMYFDYIHSLDPLFSHDDLYKLTIVERGHLLVCCLSSSTDSK